MQISFALQPDLQFKYFLCEKLKKLPREIETLSCVELYWLEQHFKRKHEAEKKAIDDARRGAKRGRRTF